MDHTSSNLHPLHPGKRDAQHANQEHSPDSDVDFGSGTAPVAVQFPDLRRRRGSPGPVDVAAAATGTVDTATGQELPTFDSVDDAIRHTHRVESNSQHRESRSARRLPGHAQADDPLRPNRLASPAGHRLMAPDVASAPVPGSSWPPVVILMIVLSAAAGLTFWIVFGGRSVDVIETGGSIDLQFTPSRVVEAPYESPIWAPSVNDSVSPVTPVTESKQTDEGDSRSYPRTANPQAWYPPRIATAVGPVSDTSTADQRTSPVVNFQGKIETPDFRARHDRNQSSLH